MNENQKRAIEQTKNPCIILAGAGTGKTFTIVEKIKHLITTGTYDPEKIVCVTFSNEAANSLRERILPSLQGEKEPSIATFHAFCAELLKKHGEAIGIAQNSTIITPDDAKLFLYKFFKLQPRQCHEYIQAIHAAKDVGISQEMLAEWITNNPLNNETDILQKKVEHLRFVLQTQFIRASTQEERVTKRKTKGELEHYETLLKTKRFLQSWKAYEKLKEKKNLLDYADLTIKAITLLKKEPLLADSFEYIIVDEFQDTNKLQLEFLTLLAPHKNITVVGDINQSIYQFRGANKESLDEFRRVFAPVQEYALNASYRSTNSILRLAHTLIEHNYENKSECFQVQSATEKEGTASTVYELTNGKEELRKIIEIIKDEEKAGTPLREICIMFRTHQQARMLKHELELHAIPFTTVTKKPLLKVPAVKTVRNYLTIIDKLHTDASGGDHAWWELLTSTVESKEDSIILSKCLKEHRGNEHLSTTLLKTLPTLTLSEKGMLKVRAVLKILTDLLRKEKNDIPTLLLEVYARTNPPSEEQPEKESALALQRFHELAKEYVQSNIPTLTDFLYHLESMHVLGIEGEAPQVDNSGVRIMTHHATKGLEYEVIIITNMAQKRFPLEYRAHKTIIPAEISAQTSDTERIRREAEHNQLHEERRLCYVAFTRAKERLYITYAKEYNSKKALPSQFLNEIEYKQNKDITFIQDANETYVQPKQETPTITAATTTAPTIPFSPSSLQTFTECQKRFEYKYVYNMPDPQPVAWEAMQLGSFLHAAFEAIVRHGATTEKQCIDITKTVHMQEAWNFIDLEEALPLVKVFFHRNKHKYASTSKTELRLTTKIGDYTFTGFADRIDFKDSNELEIIDYKTGSGAIPPRYRNWQLGFYALGAKQFGNPTKVTLDMLKKDKPLEFVIDNKGNAVEKNNGRMSFNLFEVEEDMRETADKITSCYTNGFNPCNPDKNCDFCNEYIYN